MSKTMTEQNKCDLVLEGGGVKGIALVGALSVLEEAGYRVQRVAGTSAGAIVGSLVAAGTPAARQAGGMVGRGWRGVADGRLGGGVPFLRQAQALLLEQGLDEGGYLRTCVGATEA